ncbi:MAG: valine--tRNA ligase [Helicobacter sp.]|nr:valine--tRNA ligase [Helicobacter sp.]
MSTNADAKELDLFEIDSNKAIQDSAKGNFCLLMPPPNVTGSLHIGHALTFTLQDIMARYKRMDGYRVLYQGGFDHAGIATQNIVEKNLLKQGIKKQDLTREEFIAKVFEQKEISQQQIINQMRKLNISQSWSRNRFTMDEGLANAVKNAFVKLYDDGLIVQDDYMINWCIKDGALSDIEVEYKENDSKLYHLRYFLENSSEYIVIATTRPETFFGDVAVMINPLDPKYETYKGKNVILPLVNKTIPIIADSIVDMEFGSGFVKVTPAHDFNDYEVGKRHNLEAIKVFDEKGILNERALEFQGLDRIKAREAIIERLDSLGFVEKIEDYKNKIGICYRCGEVIEPYISKQWFVKSDIAKSSIAKIDEINFHPKEWLNNYNAWMKDLKPWCISRQLIWGHQIPVFHCKDCKKHFASTKKETVCKFCGGEVVQDSDVLDTWFSSGLFAISTLGFMNDNWGLGEKYNADDMINFYPNSLLITAFDILFFWVARMIFMSENLTQKMPFKNIYLHALVRDEHGAKMSKSKGNGIDPLEVIEKFGSDNLRFSLALLCVQGRDIRLSNKKFEDIASFIIKIKNALNFLKLYAAQQDPLFRHFKSRHVLSDYSTSLGIYLKSCLNETIKNVRTHLDNYRFENASLELYSFFWFIFCDFGIELAKAQKEAIFELGSIFKEFLILAHPFMPDLSQELYSDIDDSKIHLAITKYPSDGRQNKDLKKDFEIIKDAITSIRRLKITAPKITHASLHMSQNLSYLKPEDLLDFAKKLTRLDISFTQKRPSSSIADIAQFCESYAHLELSELQQIRSRLQKSAEKLEAEVQKLQKLLNNEKFIAQAPDTLIESYKSALLEADKRREKVKSELENLA